MQPPDEEDQSPTKRGGQTLNADLFKSLLTAAVPTIVITVTGTSASSGIGMCSPPSQTLSPDLVCRSMLAAGRLTRWAGAAVCSTLRRRTSTCGARSIFSSFAATEISGSLDTNYLFPPDMLCLWRNSCSLFHVVYLFSYTCNHIICTLSLGWTYLVVHPRFGSRVRCGGALIVSFFVCAFWIMVTSFEVMIWPMA
jgi:hypothetical protein